MSKQVDEIVCKEVNQSSVELDGVTIILSILYVKRGTEPLTPMKYRAKVLIAPYMDTVKEFLGLCEVRRTLSESLIDLKRRTDSITSVLSQKTPH